MRWANGARLRRAGAVVVVLVLALGAAGYATASSAAPAPKHPHRVVANPGRFVGVAGPGSYYEYLGDDGQQVTNGGFDAGNPMCGDGIDNDVDGVIDQADSGCASPDDANERLDGVQQYHPSTLPVRIKADGTVILDPADLVIEPVEKCNNFGYAEPWCIRVAPVGAGPVMRGSVRRDGRITVPIPMTVKFEALTGYPGYDQRCEVGLTANVYVGDDYDADTGTFTLETGPDNIAPGLTNCGDWTDVLNAVLSMPATAHSVLHITLTNAKGEHPQWASR